MRLSCLQQGSAGPESSPCLLPHPAAAPQPALPTRGSGHAGCPGTPYPSAGAAFIPALTSCLGILLELLCSYPTSGAPSSAWNVGIL